MAQRKQLPRQISNNAKRLMLSFLVFGLVLQRPFFVNSASAQSQSSSQTPVSVGLFRDQLPQSFRVTDRKSGKTLVFESRGNGYYFYTVENLRRSKFVPFAKIDQVLVTMLEDRMVREGSGTDARTSRSVSTLVKVPLSEGNVANRLLTGVVRNDGTTFSGSLLTAGGKILADLDVNLSEAERIGQVLYPGQLSSDLFKSGLGSSSSLRKGSLQLKDTKLSLNNSFGYAAAPVTLGSRPPVFEVVTITIGVAIVAVAGCIFNAYMTECGKECVAVCGEGQVASYEEGWCGASCSCNCKQ